MADKIIAMPTDDEIFAAFQHALEVGVPADKKTMIGVFNQFIGKAKEHLKTIISLSDTGLSLNLTEQTGNELLKGFIGSQNMILKMALKGALSTFGAGTFTDFINSVKTGKNGKEGTTSGITNILAACFDNLGEKYAVTETHDTVKAKVDALFA